MHEMPTPRELDLESYPRVAPVFEAASHSEALIKADALFRQQGVEAALWLQEQRMLTREEVDVDRNLWRQASSDFGIEIGIETRKSRSNQTLKAHYDGWDIGAPNREKDDRLFSGVESLRVIILRGPFNEKGLGTIIFDQGQNRFDDLMGSFAPSYKDLGTPWQAPLNSALFFKSHLFGYFQAALHAEPVYDLTNENNSVDEDSHERWIDIINLNCTESTPLKPLSL